ncbi:MAG: A/G-specific adenine glycosylase [Bacteroidales bacterium]|nr:A/G-specific adenine glycosylase [Bacteroidales bacterium]
MTVSETLALWYTQRKRELPWRNTKSPYKIWLSEIILQQTRVEQGLGYYLKFVEKYPDIKKLASAPLDEVMKLWQGLGYYSRARNLHTTAGIIASEYNGCFPDNFKSLLLLKGIGPYTAAAIASICFNEPVAVLDGNVYRFLSRYYGIEVAAGPGRRIFSDHASALLDRHNPGNHNQAVMEFGALQCTPVNPACEICPLLYGCKAYNNNMVKKLPVKNKKPKTTERYFNYLVIGYKNYIYLKQRTGNDIWKMLYEFPVIEGKEPEGETEITGSEQWKEILGNQHDIKILDVSEVFKHLLTHQRIFARFYRVEIQQTTDFLEENYVSVKKDDIWKYPVNRLIERYIDNVF